MQYKITRVSCHLQEFNMKRGIIKFLLFFLLSSSFSNTQVLEPDWKKGVVVIDQKVGNNLEAIATGIAIMFRNTTYIVTNAHVATLSNLYLRINSKDHGSPPIELSIDSILSSRGIPLAKSPDADIAAIPMFKYSSMEKQFDSLELKSIGISLFKNWDYINEGDDLFVLGFPMQLGSGTRSQPVYRYGIVSLKDKPGQYLIDCTIYPGNSGGPVFLKPSFYNYRDKSIRAGTSAYFVGIVSAYIPYTDVAISTQTKRPRITFEENSGLAIVISADKIQELLATFSAKYKLDE